MVPMLIPQPRHLFAAGVVLPAAGVVLLALACAGRRAEPVAHAPVVVEAEAARETPAMTPETPAPATEAPAPAATAPEVPQQP